MEANSERLKQLETLTLDHGEHASFEAVTDSAPPKKGEGG